MPDNKKDKKLSAPKKPKEQYGKPGSPGKRHYPPQKPTKPPVKKKPGGTDSSRYYELSVIAGMNQRYHQTIAARWGCGDAATKITVGLFAVAGAVVSVATSGGGWGTASIVVSFIAAFAAISLNVVPLSDRKELHLDLFRRWTGLREAIDTLPFSSFPSKSRDLIYKDLLSKQHQICASEPLASPALLQKCFDEEQESRMETED